MRANYHTLTCITHPKHTQLASALPLPLCHDTQALKKFRTKDAHAAEKGKNKNKSRESEVGSSEEWTPGTEQGTKRKKTVIFLFSRFPFSVSHSLTRVRALSRSLSRLLFLSCSRCLCRKMDNVPIYILSRILTNTHRVMRKTHRVMRNTHRVMKNTHPHKHTSCDETDHDVPLTNLSMYLPTTYAYSCRQEASGRYHIMMKYCIHVSVCVRARVCLYVHTRINT